MISETTGTNHIDLEECKKRNITVMFSPHAATEAVSEHALGLVSFALDNRQMVSNSNSTFQSDALSSAFTTRCSTIPLMLGHHLAVCPTY